MDENKIERSNCTFMELKWGTTPHVIQFLYSSNCTFMELKLICLRQRSVNFCVLIVPLWN